jgi:hypothetical protein
VNTNIKKREIYKTFEFEGRTWRIGKFDAGTGAYYAYKLMEEMLPAFLGGNTLYAEGGIPKPTNNKTMSKQSFLEMQKDCLWIVEEMLPAGPVVVLDKNGNFAVNDLENDAKTVLLLTIQALTWNVADFFDENLLLSMQEAMETIFKSIAKTSTSSSTDQ